MLIEDIQLGICAMHSKIWQLQERIRESSDQEINNESGRHDPKRRLDAWKDWIIRIPVQQLDQNDFSQEHHLAM